MQVQIAEKLSKSLSIKKNIDRFSEIWSEYDHYGTGYIPTKYLKELLMKLPMPLGYSGATWMKDYYLTKLIDALNIPDHEGLLYFPEVMWPLFHALIGNSSKKLDSHSWIRTMLR